MLYMPFYYIKDGDRMNKFINKLVEIGVIQNVVDGEEFVLTEDFLQELQVEISGLKAINNYCIDVPCDALKGSIPYVDTVAPVVDNGNETGELNVEIKLASFELKDFMAYIPVPSTIEKLAPKTVKSLMTKVLAKEYVRKINYKASQELKIKARISEAPFVLQDGAVVDTIVNFVYAKQKGFVIVDSTRVNDILGVLDKDKLDILKTEIIPIENFGNCVVAGDFAELYFLHNAKEMHIHDNFIKNTKELCLKEFNAFLVANPNAFAVFELQ